MVTWETLIESCTDIADIISFGSRLYLRATIDAAASVYVSEDNGDTWEVEFVYDCYFAVLNNIMYCLPQVYAVVYYVYDLDGNRTAVNIGDFTWNAYNLYEGSFNGLLFSYDQISGQLQTATDGNSWVGRLANFIPSSYKQVGDYLYIGGRNDSDIAVVYRTLDGINYTVVWEYDVAYTNVVSIEEHNGIIYYAMYYVYTVGPDTFQNTVIYSSDAAPVTYVNTIITALNSFYGKLYAHVWYLADRTVISSTEDFIALEDEYAIDGQAATKGIVVDYRLFYIANVLA